MDFASERNGERDLNPARLAAVVETFSDPRYRLGLADVQPDFLGRAYEYLLRKFAEGSGQSAGEFFTPTEVGFLMAHLMRPRPGETCHDYACGSAGLLIKLQLVARETDPTSRVPLKLYGQELQSDSYAVAHMNAIIHDMDVRIERGDTIINPKFKDAAGRIYRPRHRSCQSNVEPGLQPGHSSRTTPSTASAPPAASPPARATGPGSNTPWPA